MTQPGTTITGHNRTRRTRWTVRAADRISTAFITVGGIGTIAAVLLVCVFLIWVVAPLFWPTSIQDAKKLAESGSAEDVPVELAVDEYGLLGVGIGRLGTLTAFRTDNGGILAHHDLFGDQKPTAVSPLHDATGEIAWGFSDGSIRIVKMQFEETLFGADDLGPQVQGTRSGDLIVIDDALIQRTPQELFRRQRLTFQASEPTAGSGGPVRALGLAATPQGRLLCALTADGKLWAHRIRETTNLLTDEVEQEISAATELAYTLRAGREGPTRLMVSAAADVHLVWDDGLLVRIDAHNLENPAVVEETKLFDEEGVQVTALGFASGDATLLVGDSLGRVRAWFPVKTGRTSNGREHSHLVMAHDLEGGSAAVRSLTRAVRGRLIGAGYQDGTLRLFHVTTDALVAATETPEARPVDAVAISPRNDLMLAATGSMLWGAQFNAAHPEANLSALFRKVWYEGYPAPAHVWQSSSANDTSEPKLGFWPLIFGTIKATVYSLLFAIPIALFAAVYTSEFVSRHAKARIKPTIEMMAGLPSVVLGFIAARVVAPYLQNQVGPTLVAIVLVPVGFMLGACLWQMMPMRWSLRLGRWRWIGMFLMLGISLALAMPLGRIVEQSLFGGDIKRWLDGQGGAAAAGWLILLVPVCGLITFLSIVRWLNPALRHLTDNWSQPTRAGFEFIKFFLAVAFALGLSWGAAQAIALGGFDPRGTLLGTYEQRNAMVVGFVMGFAIIPIIYTLAEDALASVPEHLRSGSLGAGATPWQTAVRIVIPTAMSGLFSAVMVGLGRAVGETMIVLMAAGNTPVMDWNVFNGFRTLSANIAVEMPEADPSSTHYRALFLAALTLFAMTSLTNTVAELVRQRFRRRAYEL